MTEEPGSDHGTFSPGNTVGIDPAWADIDALADTVREGFGALCLDTGGSHWECETCNAARAAEAALNALTERAKQAASVQALLDDANTAYLTLSGQYARACNERDALEAEVEAVAAIRADAERLAAEVERLTERVKQAEVERDHWQRQAGRWSGLLDRAEAEVKRLTAALRRIASTDEMTGDGPLEPILENPVGVAARELKARMRLADEALAGKATNDVDDEWENASGYWGQANKISGKETT
jgi:chromosome segregation ATPase